MVKKHIIFSAILAGFLLNSCSLLNDRAISIPIKSSPNGASIYIDGQYYGETPTSLMLEPSKNYRLNLVKKGYGSSSVDLESWYSVRANRGGDNFRCVMDALGTMLILPIIGFYSVHCRDFKQPEYIVNIGNNGVDPTLGYDVNLEMIDRNGKPVVGYNPNQMPKQQRNIYGNSYDDNPYNNPYGNFQNYGGASQGNKMENYGTNNIPNPYGQQQGYQQDPSYGMPNQNLRNRGY